MTGFTTRSLPDPEDPRPGGAPLSVPIHQTATFAFPDAAELAELISSGKGESYVYSRWQNPTRAALERTVAGLEGAEAAVSFSSGMAAITTTLATLARAGDHVVFSSDLYGGTFATASKLLPRWGVEVSLAASHRTDDLLAAMRDDTTVCYVETIGNPRCSLADLPALADECRRRSVRLVVDNTFASPYLCRPAELGADVVIESSTKYLGGHHDLVGGLACGTAGLMREVREVSIDLGGTPSPFDAWLTMRGIATLAIRLGRICASALRLAEMLESHPSVARVWYPGLPTHPDHDLARRLLPRGASGMMAVELAGGLEAGRRFCETVRVARMAASLGGVHTLVIHPATVTHTQLGRSEREAIGVTDGLLRISVGIEDVEDLLEDFAGALGG
ncbi:MAG TPA: aminotransferase class I/II-fold pyridoxal phosphate-dependent enzyme [Actinomycetota bacterium]|nr:aminotransferase class I/II-fold pyridoxal phosphate-dependent enzyme [Actinomycetota bacterium]